MEATLSVPSEIIRQDEGGVWRVGSSRVSLDSLLHAFHDGASAEEIALRYQTLTLPQVYAAISLYLQNQTELDAYLAARRQARTALQAETETHTPPQGIREHLLARRRTDPQ